MVDVSISNGNLVLHVKGLDELWTLKNSLEIPLAHITEIKADPTVAHGWWHGLKMPGTNIPGAPHRWHFLSIRPKGFLGCSQSG